MGPAAGPVATNGLLDKLVLPSWERFNLTAHYGSNSWTNGLLDKLDFPNTERFGPSARYGSSSWTNGLPTMGPAAGPMACWASLFFPLGNGLNHTAHYGSSSCTNGLLDKLVLPSWERLSFPVRCGSSSWPLACWTSEFPTVGDQINPPAHYGSSSWTDGLLDKLVLP